MLSYMYFKYGLFFVGEKLVRPKPVELLLGLLLGR